MCVTVGRTESYETLSRKAPPSSLIGVTPLCSLALQIILIVAFQVLAVVLLWRQPWYVFHIPTDDEDLVSTATQFLTTFDSME